MQEKSTREHRFWSKVNKDGPIPEYRPDLGPCWIWIGAIDPQGYGSFSKPIRRAHRCSYTLVKGEIPQGLELDHLCRVRRCVNPSHLEAVAHIVNVYRGAAPFLPTARAAMLRNIERQGLTP